MNIRGRRQPLATLQARLEQNGERCRSPWWIPFLRRSVSLPAPVVSMAALLLAALVVATPAQAQRLTGAILLEQCQARLSGATGFASGLCIGTLAGALEAHDTLLPRDERLYCLGDRSVTNDHAVRIVVRWLKDHPEQQARPAATAVVFALRDAFPCEAPAAASAPR